MRNKLLAGLAAGFIATVGVAAPAQAISPTTADLYVLHAVPGLTVDVWVDGAVLLEDFAPGTLTDPLDLPAGDYEVVVTAVNDPITSPAIGPVTLTLAASTSYTAVAHLAADGTPTATLFTNDLSTIAAGQGRLTVRHTAAAPAVDVLANGAPAFTNLTNPNEVKADLPGRHHLGRRRGNGDDRSRDRTGRRRHPGRRQHDRLRVGKPRRPEPRAGCADHQRSPLQPGRRALRAPRVSQPTRTRPSSDSRSPA